MSESVLNVLEKIEKNEYLEKNRNDYLNKLLDVTIDDIKKDCKQRIILSILKRITVISFSDKKLETANKRELYRLYTDSKEIVVKNRKNKMNCIISISDEFNLKTTESELTYFILVMYYMSIKLNDTFPMIPGLYKQLLPLCNLEEFFSEAEECMYNKPTDWVELEDYNIVKNTKPLANIEYMMSYDSLNNRKYNKSIKAELMSTMYVSEENVSKVIYQERMIFSKYFNPRYEMIIIE